MAEEQVGGPEPKEHSIEKNASYPFQQSKNHFRGTVSESFLMNTLEGFPVPTI